MGRKFGVATSMARAVDMTAQPLPICMIAMLEPRTGSRAGQRTRSNGAALMDTRGARKTPPWSKVLGMEPARTEGPLLSVLPWQATNRASCYMRWPHRESTTMRCPGEGQGRPGSPILGPLVFFEPPKRFALLRDCCVPAQLSLEVRRSDFVAREFLLAPT